ncbi:MAG TPA: HD family phosphohydrolase, partial [Desulfosalsimonadaceae bacterium]|nr:HD family phosphohydrolase [Desulfosalsimonadaceae bacterium]
MAPKRTDITVKNRFLRDTVPLLGLLAAITVIATLILYPKLIISKPSYAIGDIADHNIKAPRDLLIEDKPATEEKRVQARESVLTVYDHDPGLAGKLAERIKQAFRLPRSVYQEPPLALEGGKPSPARPAIEKRIAGLKPEFEKALGITVSKGAYRILQNEGFSRQIPEALIHILSRILETGVVANKDLLLRENETGIVLKTVDSEKETVVRDLERFHGLNQARSSVRSAGASIIADMNYSLANLIVDFAQRLIQPNITLNRRETRQRRETAATEIKPVLYKIKKGEMILREGQRVEAAHMVKLRALKKQGGKQELVQKGAGTALIILTLLVIAYCIHLQYQNALFQRQNKNLFFIGFVIVLVLLILQLSVSLAQVLAPEAPFSLSAQSLYYSIPIAAGAMTICQFLGFTIAFPFAIVIGLLTAMAFEQSYGFCLFFLLSGIVGAYWSRDCRENKGFIQAGAKLGVLNMALAAVVSIYMADFSGFKLAWDMLFAFSGGIMAGILTAGVIPLMEMAFDYRTNSTLLELANLDKPLLRRLMLEAPG